MGHHATIGAAAHDITGGKALVSGTVRALTSGRTRVGGTSYDIPLDWFDPDLNNNTWEQISLASQKGVAERVWNVGDTKEITLSGSVRGIDLSGTYLCYILGFNHNAALEGDNRIHFQLARSTDGVELCFAGFISNDSSQKTDYGWAGSYLRQSTIGIDPADCAYTVLGALPEDLRAVLRPTQKYSDNGTKTSQKVTATTDYLWVPAEKEVFGAIDNNWGTKEQCDYQEQYAFYAAGGSLVRKTHTGRQPIEWWTRSRMITGLSAPYFVTVGEDGGLDYSSVDNAMGIAPIFCV